MATFVPDKPPLSWGPSPGGSVASAQTQTLQHEINHQDIYPVFLQAGKSYQIFANGHILYTVWDDFARKIVEVPPQFTPTGINPTPGYVSSFKVEQSGLHYVVVQPSAGGWIEWLNNLAAGKRFSFYYYGVSVYELDIDLGPNRTRTSLDDILDGGPGTDLLMGYSGNDTIRGLDGNDTVNGEDGDDDVNGNLGNDTVHGTFGRDFVRGGQGDDWVFGGDGDDFHVNGNIGNDNVSGGSGDDTVHGGPDFDVLHGDAGRDRLSGDLGNDTLYGDLHDDTFAFASNSGHDTIADFQNGDRIEIARDLNGSGIVDHASLVDRIFDAPGGARVELGGGNFFIVTGWAKDALGPDLFMFV